jgi:predicted MFS family arabinose efflux permease
VLLGSGLTLQALGLAWLAVATGPATPYTDLVPGFIMAGIGMGLTFAPSATAVLADMAPDDHATASSTNSTIREIGVALGVAVLVAVFRANGGTLTPAGYNLGLRAAILTGAAVVALGALSTIWLPSPNAPAVAISQVPSSQT